MKRHLFYITIVELLIAFGLSSCEDKPKSGRTDTPKSGEISFAADESFSPILDELKVVFEALHPDAKLNPIYTNEVDGVNLLLNDSIWMTVTARNFTKKEFDNLKERNMLPEAIPLASDGMALTM